MLGSPTSPVGDSDPPRCRGYRGGSEVELALGTGRSVKCFRELISAVVAGFAAVELSGEFQAEL